MVEYNNFYSNDSKFYDLKNNYYFVSYLYHGVLKGYYNGIDVYYIQSLLNKITLFYEYKYDDKCFINNDSKSFNQFDYFGFNNFIKYLSDDELNFLNCFLNKINMFSLSDKREYKKNVKYNFFYDNNCMVNFFNHFNNLENDNYLKLKELRKKLSNFNYIDLSKLDFLINKYNFLNNLRVNFFKCAALSLLYSRNTSCGYDRAVIFIKEVNSYFNTDINVKFLNIFLDDGFKFNLCSDNIVFKFYYKCLDLYDSFVLKRYCKKIDYLLKSGD